MRALPGAVATVRLEHVTRHYRDDRRIAPIRLQVDFATICAA
jgi:hypothetical protein